MLEPEITEIAHDIWETMFGVQIAPRDPGQEAGAVLTSLVQIDGAWRGAVTLHCAESLARDLTKRLLDDSTDDATRDLFGELANQLGGNIKAMLPEPCSLSLPTVVVGSDYDVSVVDTAVAAAVTFDCDGHPLTITLLERLR